MKKSKYLTLTKQADNYMLLTSGGYIVSSMFCNAKLLAMRLNK